MTQDNKSYADSFRIRNYENQLASVWQIGSGDFFAVKFDEDDEPLIYTHGDVSNAFRNGWIIVGDESVKEELKSFKYYHEDESPDKVNTWDNSGITTRWNGQILDWVDANMAEKFIKEGRWIVLPNKDKKPIDTLQLKIEIDGINETQAILDEMVEQSNTTLESIKMFTYKSGHSVFIDNGIYKVYRKHEDFPYICQNDWELLSVIDALDCLDAAGKE